MVEAFSIANHRIGPSKPAFIIAEAGVNHNGDLNTAYELVDAAAYAGADAVKFQTWVTEKLCAPGAPKAPYQQEEVGIEEDQFTMLKRLELPYEWHSSLQQRAIERGLIFLSTPDEIDSARFLVGIGVPALKIGSGEVTNHLFLRQLSRLGRPVLLSTGMSTLEEVEGAIAVLRTDGPLALALLHCVSAYPAPDAAMNLRCLATLQAKFQVPVGLSDHSMGTAAALIAVGVGMSLLEKHLTLDKRAPGPDHAASATPDEFRHLVSAVRAAEEMLGTGTKVPAVCEIDTRAAVRRSLHYSLDLFSGHPIALEDMVALRSGVEGLAPQIALTLEGRHLKKAASAGHSVALSDFAP